MIVLLVLAVLVAAPIAEIYVLLEAGAALGVWTVIAACLATALIGGAILRFQGLAAISGARRDLEAGKVPVEAAVDGVFLAVAAPLLLTPGFITDTLGFLLLIPPLRHGVARAALSRLRRSAERGAVHIRIEGP